MEAIYKNIKIERFMSCTAKRVQIVVSFHHTRLHFTFHDTWIRFNALIVLVNKLMMNSRTVDSPSFVVFTCIYLCPANRLCFIYAQFPLSSLYLTLSLVFFVSSNSPRLLCIKQFPLSSLSSLYPAIPLSSLYPTMPPCLLCRQASILPSFHCA